MAAMTSHAAFALKDTGWQVSEGAGVQVGDDLLHDGVVAVLPFGLDQSRTGSR